MTPLSFVLVKHRVLPERQGTKGGFFMTDKFLSVKAQLEGPSTLESFTESIVFLLKTKNIVETFIETIKKKSSS